jgi:acetylornithine deacetylase/succinyl-diaminopimelate desuccinylase-like protein
MGFRVKDATKAYALALERGAEPVEVSTGGGSDANALRAAGFDALLLANGTEANHTPDESVSAEALVRMLDVCTAIVAEAGRG